MPFGSHAVVTDRSHTLFDACLARLDAALEHAENAGVVARWQQHYLVASLYRRAARLPKSSQTQIPARLLLVACGGPPTPYPLLLLDLEARGRVERDGPAPLLHLARAVEMGVADLERLGQRRSGIIGYYERGGRVCSTYIGSLRTRATGELRWAYALTERAPSRLCVLIFTSAAFGSVAGRSLAAVAHLLH